DAAIERGAGPTTQPVAFQSASASFEQTSGGEGNPYRKWPAQAAIDGDKFGPTLGWAIADRFNQPNYAIFETAADLGAADELALAVTLKFTFGGGHGLGKFRISVTDAPRPIRPTPTKNAPENIVKIIETPAEQRAPAQKTELAAYFRDTSP